MNNILTAIFKDNKYCHVSGLWQYDYGQVLRIQGLNLPKAVEIHFSLTESSGDSITRIGTTKDGATDVIIPDSMLENGDTGQNYNIYAFIFLSEIDSGNTEYRIKISVKARPKPEIPGTLEEPELFRETINAVNDAADRAETAERNAKLSEEAAAEHAKKTEGSVIELDTAREKALKEINDKKAEGVNAVVKQKETSEQSVTEHTDREIQRVTQKANEINNSLNKSITEASNKKSALDESVNTSVETKKQLDLSIESGKKTKADLDQSIENSKNAKSNLDGSVEEANTIKTELAEAVETASTLDGSLGIKIEEGKQVEKNIVASGEKAVEDINTTGAEKLKVMQDIAEEFAADRKQIDTNKNNISSLKEDIDNIKNTETQAEIGMVWTATGDGAEWLPSSSESDEDKYIGVLPKTIPDIGYYVISDTDIDIFTKNDTPSETDSIIKNIQSTNSNVTVNGDDFSVSRSGWQTFADITKLLEDGHTYYYRVGVGTNVSGGWRIFGKNSTVIVSVINSSDGKPTPSQGSFVCDLSLAPITIAIGHSKSELGTQKFELFKDSIPDDTSIEDTTIHINLRANEPIIMDSFVGKTFHSNGTVKLYKYGKNNRYVLPIATESVLGGVKAISKTDEMTERIGVDENGNLWAKPTNTPIYIKPLYNKNVLFIGDSLTEGDGGINPQTQSRDHPTPYPTHFGDYTNCVVYNHGHSGAWARSWKDNFYANIDQTITYDVALICLGTNGGIDIEDKNGLKSIIEQLQSDQQQCRIYLIAPPYSSASGSLQDYTLSAYRGNKELSELFHLPFIDMYYESGFNEANNSLYRPNDGIHFNEDGYKKMAVYIANKVLSTLCF